MWRQCAMVLCVLVVALSGIGMTNANPYIFRDMGDNQGTGNQSMAFAINNNNTAVGYATTEPGGLGYVGSVGFKYTYSGGMTNVGTTVCAKGINDVGQVVGYHTNTDGTYSGFLYSAGTTIDLGGGDATHFGRANTVNSNGIVGGQVLTSNAAFWFDPINNPTTYTDLRASLVSTFGAGTGGQAVIATNSNYALVGYSVTFYTKSCIYDLNAHAFLTPTVTGLGGNNTFGGSAAAANGLQGGGTGISPNFDAAGHGWVVGASNVPAQGNTIRAYSASLNGSTWTMTQLGSLGDSTTTSRAYDVNSAGNIVGWSYLSGSSGAQHAFLYSGGTMQDLNTLYANVIPSGWTLEQAADINDSGTITGRMVDGSGNYHGFVVAPAMTGDATLDGVVGLDDLSRVLTNYDKSGLAWTDGDFNGDGTVNLSDLSNVLTNYDKSLGASAAGIKAVPEPGTLSLLAAGLIGLVACAWRKRT